ncbi:MAG: AIDA repeat-containing protein, partial [Anaerovibrio sp.]|nr:AIDA repeat-containing protein [Anaerovibrio sp.]
MKRTSKKSWNLQKKLAVAMSLVNALNTTAPVALPYVNVARDMKAPGGQVQGLTEAFAAHLYSTAQAYYSQEVPDEYGTTVFSHQEIESGGTQNVNSGGTAKNNTVLEGGVQNVNSGGKTYNTTINSGGTQNINKGGYEESFTVYGTQNVYGSGASGGVSNGGVQNIYDGGRITDSIVYNGGT